MQERRHRGVQPRGGEGCYRGAAARSGDGDLADVATDCHLLTVDDVILERVLLVRGHVDPEVKNPAVEYVRQYVTRLFSQGRRAEQAKEEGKFGLEIKPLRKYRK